MGQGNPSSRLASQPVKVTFAGTALLTGSDPNTDDGYLGVRNGPEVDAQFSKPQISGTLSPARVPADHAPAPAGNALGSEAVFGFRGLTHRDQRVAPTGVPNGINLNSTPPDQGLAVGNGYVVEAVNNAVAVYDAATKARLRLSALSGFFGVAPEFNLATGAYGPFLSDPKVYYDWETGHFFLTELELGVVPATGAFDRTSAARAWTVPLSTPEMRRTGVEPSAGWVRTYWQIW